MSFQRQQCREDPVCPVVCSCDQSREYFSKLTNEIRLFTHQMNSEEYGDKEETLDCRERDLTKVPTRISTTVNTIRLEDNKIRSLSNRQFSPYKQLKHLDLSDNQIETVDENAFYGLTNLQRVLLYENKIKTVEVGTFARLSNLKILFMSSNQISCLHRDTFRDLGKLEVLTFYDNQLTTLPKGIFDHNKVRVELVH